MNQALVSLRIDNEDADRRYHDVIDVPSAARDVPIVKNSNPGDACECLGELLLAGCADRPRLRRLWIATKSLGTLRRAFSDTDP